MVFPDKSEYQKMIKSKNVDSPIFKDCIFAFVTGGLICTVGQLIVELFLYLKFDLQSAFTLCSVTLIFISAFLTGIGVYDNIARHAGAGTLVPITGFANAVCAPSVEFKTEGYVLGMGVKMFTIAGPVIVFGTFASTVYGIIYYAVTALM